MCVEMQFRVSHSLTRTTLYCTGRELMHATALLSIMQSYFYFFLIYYSYQFLRQTVDLSKAYHCRPVIALFVYFISLQKRQQLNCNVAIQAPFSHRRHHSITNLAFRVFPMAYTLLLHTLSARMGMAFYKIRFIK